MKGTREGSHGGIYLGLFVFPTVLQSRGELSLNECTLIPVSVYTDRNLSCVAGNKNTFWDILKGNLHEASKWHLPFMKCRLPLLGLQTWAHRDSMDYPKQAASTPVLFVHTTRSTYWSRMQASLPLNSVENPAFCVAFSDVETSPNALNDIPREKAVANSADRMSPLHLGAAPE
ncbi:unnamed protein product [Ixodes pacificus]